MFGMDVLAETMESMELEIISLKARLEYWKKRAEKAENVLIDIQLFGKTQPQPNCTTITEPHQSDHECIAPTGSP